jgi:hypothetical protein
MTDLEKAAKAREEFLLEPLVWYTDSKGELRSFHGVPVREVESLEGLPEYDFDKDYPPPGAGLKPTLINKLRSAWQAAIEDWRNW